MCNIFDPWNLWNVKWHSECGMHANSTAWSQVRCCEPERNLMDSRSVRGSHRLTKSLHDLYDGVDSELIEAYRWLFLSGPRNQLEVFPDDWFWVSFCCHLNVIFLFQMVESPQRVLASLLWNSSRMSCNNWKRVWTLTWGTAKDSQLLLSLIPSKCHRWSRKR